MKLIVLYSLTGTRAILMSAGKVEKCVCGYTYIYIYIGGYVYEVEVEVEEI